MRPSPANNAHQRLPTVFVAVIMPTLGGCRDRREFQWHDTTGAGRDESVVLADRRVCEETAPLPRHQMSADKTIAMVEKFDDCVKRKGWEIK